MNVRVAKHRHVHEEEMRLSFHHLQQFRQWLVYRSPSAKFAIHILDIERQILRILFQKKVIYLTHGLPFLALWKRLNALRDLIRQNFNSTLFRASNRKLVSRSN